MLNEYVVCPIQWLLMQMLTAVDMDHGSLHQLLFIALTQHWTRSNLRRERFFDSSHSEGTVHRGRKVMGRNVDCYTASRVVLFSVQELGPWISATQSGWVFLAQLKSMNLPQTCPEVILHAVKLTIGVNHYKPLQSLSMCARQRSKKWVR